MRYHFFFKRHWPLAASAAALTGCATIPHVDRPSPPHSLSALATSQSFAADNTVQASWPEEAWWRSFGDATLNILMDEALQQSPDLALATARIQSADAFAEQAGAAFAPIVNVEASAGGNKQSYAMGIPVQFVPKGVVSTGRATASLGFNLDLWGRNRAALAAARGDAEAARVDAAQSRLLLTTSLANAWVDYSQLHEARDVAAAMVAARRQTEGLTAARVEAGIDSRSDLELAQSRTSIAAADLASVEEALGLTRNRIAALLGAGPDRGATLPRPAMARLSGAGVPANLEASLLGRRPDLVSARLRVEAAAQRIKVAKRSFYPNINLIALGGVQSLGLRNLFDSGSTTANFGPAISLPLFDGGQLAGRYRGANAAYAEAVGRYDQTLISALRETADVITSRQALGNRMMHLRSAHNAAREAANLARLRYREGIGNMLQVNAAEDAALMAQRALTDIEARAFLLDISLIRTLGGGFTGQMTPKDKASHD